MHRIHRSRYTCLPAVPLRDYACDAIRMSHNQSSKNGPIVIEVVGKDAIVIALHPRVTDLFPWQFAHRFPCIEDFFSTTL